MVRRRGPHTAQVKPQPSNPRAHIRQGIYLNALQTLSRLRDPRAHARGQTPHPRGAHTSDPLDDSMGGKFGIQTIDAVLSDLVRRGRISKELALHRCSDQEGFQRLMVQTG